MKRNNFFKRLISAVLALAMVTPVAWKQESVKAEDVTYDWETDFKNATVETPNGASGVWTNGYYGKGNNVFIHYTYYTKHVDSWNATVWKDKEANWAGTCIAVNETSAFNCVPNGVADPAILFTAPEDGFYNVYAKIQGPPKTDTGDGIQYKLQRTDVSGVVSDLFPETGFVYVGFDEKPEVNTCAYLEAGEKLGIRFNCYDGAAGDQFYIKKYTVTKTDGFSFSDEKAFLSYYTQSAYASYNTVTLKPNLAYDNIEYTSSDTEILEPVLDENGVCTTGEFLVKGYTTGTPKPSADNEPVVTVTATAKDNDTALASATQTVRICTNNIGKNGSIYRWIDTNVVEQGWARGPVWEYYVTTAVDTTAANAVYDKSLVTFNEQGGSTWSQLNFNGGIIRLSGLWMHSTVNGDMAIAFTAPRGGYVKIYARGNSTENKYPKGLNPAGGTGIRYAIRKNNEKIYPSGNDEFVAAPAQVETQYADQYVAVSEGDKIYFVVSPQKNGSGSYAAAAYEWAPVVEYIDLLDFGTDDEFLTYFTQDTYKSENTASVTATATTSGLPEGTEAKIVYTSSNTDILEPVLDENDECTTGEFKIKGYTTKYPQPQDDANGVTVTATLVIDGVESEKETKIVHICASDLGKNDPIYAWRPGNYGPEQGWSRGPVWEYSMAAHNSAAATATYDTSLVTFNEQGGSEWSQFEFNEGKIRLYGLWMHSTNKGDMVTSFIAPRSGILKVTSQTYPKSLQTDTTKTNGIRYAIRKNNEKVYPAGEDEFVTVKPTEQITFEDQYVNVSAGDKLHFVVSTQVENGSGGAYQWSPQVEYVETVTFSEDTAFLSYLTSPEYASRNNVNITAEQTSSDTNGTIVYTSSNSDILESVNDDGSKENTTGKFIIKGQTSTSATLAGEPVIVTASLIEDGKIVGTAEKKIYIRNNNVGMNKDIYHWWLGGITGAEQGWDTNGPIWYYGIVTGSNVSAADSEVRFGTYAVECANEDLQAGGAFRLQSTEGYAVYRLDMDWKHLVANRDMTISFKAPRAGMVKIGATGRGYPTSLGGDGATGLNFAIRKEKQVLWPETGEWHSVEKGDTGVYDDTYTYVNEGEYIHFVVAAKDGSSANGAYSWAPSVEYVTSLGDESIQRDQLSSSFAYRYTPEEDLDNASLICAIYDENGDLIGMSEKSVDAVANNEIEVTFDINTEAMYNANNVKFFLWNDMVSIAPIKNATDKLLDIDEKTIKAMVPQDGKAFSITDDSVQLSWEIEEEASGYGVFDGENLVSETSDLRCKISGLKNDTSYNFIIKAKTDDGWSEDGAKVSFKTGVPEHNPSSNMYVVNDTHTLSFNQASALTRALHDANNRNSSVFVINGDITNDGMKTQIDWTKEMVAEIAEYPVYYTIGNHDIRWQPGGLEQTTYHFTNDYGMPGLYYDTWVDGYHLIMLGSEVEDSDYICLSDAQLDWLEEKASEGADANKPIVVFSHQPMEFVKTDAMKNRLKEIFSKYPQIIFTTGHMHTKQTVVEENECTYLDASYGAGGLTTILELYEDGVLIQGRDLGANTIYSENFVSGLSKAQAEKVYELLSEKLSGSEQAMAVAEEVRTEISDDRLKNGILVNKLYDAVYAVENAGSTYNVSGAVKFSDGTPAMGITVKLGNKETVSGVNGFYSFADVSDGSHTVKVSTEENNITVFGGTVIGVDFEVSEPTTAAPEWEDGAELTASNVTANSVTVTIPQVKDSSYAMMKNGEYVEVVSGSEYTFKNLKAGMKYTFGVCAVDASGNMSEALELKVTTASPETAPNWENGSFTATNNTISSFTLTWPSADSAAGYVLCRGNLPIARTRGDVTEYIVTGLPVDSEVEYSIKAYNKDGIYSSELTCTAQTLTDTTAPEWKGYPWDEARIVAYDKNETGLSLAWFGADDDTAVKEYKVYQGSTLLGTTTDTCYTVTDLTEGTEYTFKVEAVDIYGNTSSNGPNCTAKTAVNIALNKTTSSSIDGDTTHTQAVDGITMKNTGWRAWNQPGGNWLTIDLGEAYAIDSVEIIPNSKEGAEEAYRFTLQLSADAEFTSPKDILTVGETNPISKQTPIIQKVEDAGEYRYVRYLTTAHNSFYIPEIRVYAK